MCNNNKFIKLLLFLLYVIAPVYLSYYTVFNAY